MRIKISILFSLFVFISFAQNDSLLKKKYTYSYNKYTVFAFYDIMRFTGIGFEYRLSPAFSVDIKAGAVYANKLMSENISGNKYFSDKYFYNRGDGILASSKYYLGDKKSFYLGLYMGFYTFGFKNKKISPLVSISDQNINNGTIIGPVTETTYEGDNVSKSYAFGGSIGVSKNIKRFNFEFFISVGVEKVKSTITMYHTLTSSFAPTQTTTNLYYDKNAIFNALVGIKIGLGFKEKQFIGYHYYKENLITAIKAEDAFVKQLNPSDSLFEKEIKAYYPYRNKQFKNLKQRYTTEVDPALMHREIALAGKKIKDFITDNLKNNP